MRWKTDMEKRVAISESGYRITWANNHIGRWYNAYAPDGRHIAASYERGDVLRECDKIDGSKSA